MRLVAYEVCHRHRDDFSTGAQWDTAMEPSPPLPVRVNRARHRAGMVSSRVTAMIIPFEKPMAIGALLALLRFCCNVVITLL